MIVFLPHFLINFLIKSFHSEFNLFRLDVDWESTRTEEEKNLGWKRKPGEEIFLFKFVIMLEGILFLREAIERIDFNTFHFLFNTLFLSTLYILVFSTQTNGLNFIWNGINLLHCVENFYELFWIIVDHIIIWTIFFDLNKCRSN